MKAIDLDFEREYPISPIIPQMLEIEKSAKYFFEGEGYVTLFYPTGETIENYQKNYHRYLIDNDIYTTVSTNELSYWLEKEPKPEQLRLF